MATTKVTRSVITSDAISGAEIADDAIDSEHYAAGSIDTAHIADNQITLAKMAGGTDGQIITYDASGDPVAVGPGSDGQVLTSTGAGSPPAFENAAAGGKVLQVLQTVLSDTDSTTSTSFVDLSGLSQAITPASSSNKVLVSCTIGLSGTSGGGGAMQFVRDTTAIGIGDAASSRIRVTMGSRDFSGNDFMDVWHCQFLDSPSTTSATTYKVQWLTRHSTMYMNRTVSDTDSSQYHRTITQITVMEIGA